jgi:hypothetical protein
MKIVESAKSRETQHVRLREMQVDLATNTE